MHLLPVFLLLLITTRVFSAPAIPTNYEDDPVIPTKDMDRLEFNNEDLGQVKTVNVEDIEVEQENVIDIVDYKDNKEFDMVNMEKVTTNEEFDVVNMEKVTTNEELEKLREFILVRFWQEAELEKQKALHNELAGEEVYELLTNVQKMTLNLLVGHSAFHVDK